MTTSAVSPEEPRRIDLHHHFFPAIPGVDPAAATAAILQQTGWRMPDDNFPWTPETSIAAMDRLGIEKAVLSVPQGGVIADADNRRFARILNETAHNAVLQYPDRFAFFAHVPVPFDAAAALDELAYAMDELGAVGATLVSSYGVGDDARYLGDDSFDPLWEELDRREAVVFVHGDQTPGSNRWPNRYLAIPVSEVPNETFKAAADLVTTGKKQALKKVRIVLSHSGGSTPFLASRVAGLSNYLGSPLSPDELIDSFRSFYFETALSGFETNLLALESFVAEDHLLFGTDFPAVSVETAAWYTDNVTRYYEARPARHNAVVRDNALALLPSLA
jgi:predicted TIM-barrel fold metal-dependent hydrolase